MTLLVAGVVLILFAGLLIPFGKRFGAWNDRMNDRITGGNAPQYAKMMPLIAGVAGLLGVLCVLLSVIHSRSAS